MMDRLSRAGKWNLALAVLAYRAAQSRDPWQRYLREQDRTAPAQSRPVLPIRAAGERAT